MFALNNWKKLNKIIEFRWETLLFLFLLILLIILSPTNYLIIGLTILVLAFIVWLNFNLDWGLYLLALTFPFINWQIYLIKDLNAPPVDWLGLALLLAFVLYLIRTKSFKQIKLPLLFYFTIFLTITIVSIWQSYFWEIGLKYLLRPYLFCYIIYLVLPANLIKNEKTLWRVINLIYIISLLIAGLSLIDFLFFTPATSGLPRLAPFSFGGFQPLGSNQNLLAELLVLAAPLGILLGLKTYEHQKLRAKLILGSVLFLTTIMLLTLSRAGWLVLLFQLIFFLLFIWPKVPDRILWQYKIKKIFRRYLWLSLLLILTLISLMLQLLTNPVVASSNANRLLQWKIGLDTLNFSPIFGAGPGSFMEILNRDPYFQYEFGANLDAHGLALKFLSELGILGLSAFVLFLSAIFLKAVRILIKLKSSGPEFLTLGFLLLSSGSAVLFQLFNTSYLTAKMWLPLGVLTAATYLYERRIYEKN
jgi:O-antigen ligase